MIQRSHLVHRKRETRQRILRSSLDTVDRHNSHFPWLVSVGALRCITRYIGA